jgi:MFS family permease
MFSVLHSESLGISIKLYGIYVAITFAISICLAYPLGALADRFHPTRMALVTLSLYAILTTWAGFSTQTREGFAIAFIGHGVVSGMFFTCAASIQQRLFPRERFAQFASAAGILTGVANMVIAPVVGKMLDLTNDNYSNTYFAGLVICISAIIAYAVTYRHFMKLGGPKSYVAPL